MLNYGIPETKLNELAAAFERVDVGGTISKVGGDFIQVEAYIETNELAEWNMEKVVERMTKMISCTKPLIDQILTI